MPASDRDMHLQAELCPCQQWTEIQILFMLALDSDMTEAITDLENEYRVKTLRKFCVK
jgi:hypothetical protein